ncbi:hypothetical protein C8Q77DRAFT_65013 [Trametes polyzona]|nr:hypothetical protein C8Q77DRAFT_65013 [Trametes polyzona]
MATRTTSPAPRSGDQVSQVSTSAKVSATGDDSSTTTTTTLPTTTTQPPTTTTTSLPDTTTTTTSQPPPTSTTTTTTRPDPPTTTTTRQPPTTSTTTTNPPDTSISTTTEQTTNPPPTSTEGTTTVTQPPSDGGTTTRTASASGDGQTTSLNGDSTSTRPEVTNLVTTTFQSTVFVTTTNNAGQTVTSAPPFVTETFTSTNSDGSPSFVTIVVENPTPITSNNNATQTSQFFRNKGAVAGVFLIVGLAAASIVLFIFFYIRRRRRTQRLEHDTAVASTLAAAGFNRRPLDGDDEERKVMTQPMASGTLASLPNPSMGSGGLNGQRPPSSGMDDVTNGSGTGPSTPGAGGDFDPYAAYGTIHPPPAAFPTQARRDGYAPARTSSPPPPAWQRQHTHSTSTSASSMGWGHAAKGSVGSHEPLLSGYYAGGATEPSTPALGPTLNLADIPPGAAPPVPPRDPRRPSGEAARPRGGAADRGSSATSSSVYSVDDYELADERPKLEVRNLPDGVTLSDISREPSRRG